MAFRSSSSQYNTPKNYKPLKEKIAELQKTSNLYENNVNLYVPNGSSVQPLNQTPASLKTLKDFSILLHDTEFSDKDESTCKKLDYAPFESEGLNQTPSPNFDKLAVRLLSPNAKRTLPNHVSQVSYTETLNQACRMDKNCRLKSRNSAYKPIRSSTDYPEIPRGNASPNPPRITITYEVEGNDAKLWNQVNTLLETHGFSSLLLTESQQPEFKSLSETFVAVVSEFSKLHRQVVRMTKDRQSPDIARCTSSTRISDTFKTTQNSPKMQERGRNFLISKEEKIFESFLKRRFDPDNFMDSHIMAIITFYEEKLKLKEAELACQRDSTQSEFRASITSFSKYTPASSETLSTENNMLKEEISHLKSELDKVMEYKIEIDKSFTGLPLISDVV